jgi:hypothetical protein
VLIVLAGLGGLIVGLLLGFAFARTGGELRERA